VRDDLKRVRTVLEQRENRIETLESQVTSLGWWVKLGVSLVVVLLAVILWLLVRVR
jgi:hypothetical protein